MDKLFAVAGFPILHSKSPLIFHNLFKKFDLNYEYSRISVNSANDLIDLTKNLKLSGINITSPLKESIIPLISEFDENSRRIAAVNCVKIENEKFFGFNTDVFGFINELEKHLDIVNSRILIIGAGGAARSSIFSLIKKNKSLIVINRTLDNSIKLSSEFNCNFDKIENLSYHIQNSEVIINTTNFYSDKILENIKEGAVVIDANYKNSFMINKIDSSKNNYISGKRWLINQAIESFRIFTNIENEISFNEEILLNNYYKKSSNIILIGFSGSGKTTIGKLLSTKLNYKFIDIDDEIEKKEKKSISSIFIDSGEDCFREIETRIIKEFSSLDNCVISTGGGVIERIENFQLLKELGVIFYLFNSFELSMDRIRENNRPLLMKSNYNEKLNLFNNRISKYFKFSDIIIDSSKPLEDVLNNIYYEYSEFISN